MFETCLLKEFKTKYAWKKHLLREHRTALVPQYMCELCALSFSAVDTYPTREEAALQALQQQQQKSTGRGSKKRPAKPDTDLEAAASAAAAAALAVDVPFPDYAPDMVDEFFEFASARPPYGGAEAATPLQNTA